MFNRILVPIDGSPTSQLALAEATELARLTGGTIVLLHIVDVMEHINGFERPTVHINEIRPRFLKLGQELLDAARMGLEALDVAVETVLVESEGDRVSEIIAQHATRMNADVVVLGTHGRRGVDRFLIGSDAEQVARIAPVPVMLVRASRPTSGQPPAPSRERRCAL